MGAAGAARLPPVPTEPRAADVGTLLRIVWRRKLVVLGTFLLFTVVTYVVTSSLPRRYESSARLIVSQPVEQQSFDAVQAAQVTARTYADILDSENIAGLVARRLPALDADVIEDTTSFEPVAETQLLRITAEGSTAQEAKRVADTYADVFVDYAGDRLTPRTGTTISVADAAPLPSAPSRPRPKLNTAFAALLGLLLGLGLAFLRERGDTRIDDVEDLERDFGLPPLARIPRRGRTQQSKAQFAEAFRMLRVSLTVSAGEGTAPRSVVFTSTSEGEGKTTATRQLALAAAEARRRVIVVEADVYRPQLSAALGGPVRAERGLTTYLIGEAELQDVILPTAVPNLWLLPSGPPATSLTAMLESERGRRLLPALHKALDLVIFDCPPLAPRADAALLAASADATILVLDLEITTRSRLRQALRMLASVEARVAGCVVNRDASGSGGAYSYAVDESVLAPPGRDPVEA